MTEFARAQGVSEADEFAWRRKLAIMCRIVGMQESIGLFGHVSIRVPDSDIVLMTPGAGLAKDAGPHRPDFRLRYRRQHPLSPRRRPADADPGRMAHPHADL